MLQWEMTDDRLNKTRDAYQIKLELNVAYCAMTFLQDILQNKDIHLDRILIASLVFDLLKVRILYDIFSVRGARRFEGVTRR